MKFYAIQKQKLLLEKKFIIEKYFVQQENLKNQNPITDEINDLTRK